MSEHDLDTRIRHLVARAVADAPPAPALDVSELGAVEPRRRDRRHGWWVGGGAALVAAAAAVTTLVLVADTDDRISTSHTEPTMPTVETVAPSTPGTTPPPTTQPAEPAFELTEADLVASAGPDGVVLRTVTGDVVRRLDRPASLALPVGDGRVIVQLAPTPDEDVSTSVPHVWTPDGSVVEMFPGADFVGAVAAQDVAIVDGRPTLLYVTEGEAGSPAEVAAVDLASSSVEAVATLPELFDLRRRLHLSANGLVVGTMASGSNFVAALPGSPADELVGAVRSAEGDHTLFTGSPDGSWLAWLEGTQLVELDVTATGLNEPRRRDLPFDPTGAVDLDVLSVGAIVSFGDGQDARYVRWDDGSFGVLDGPMATHGPGTPDAAAPTPSPGTTTTAAAPPTTSPPTFAAAAPMVTAGRNGLAVLQDGVEVRRLDQPAEVAFLTPGGAVIFQPPATTADGEPGDPLIWRPDGTVDRLLGELGEVQSYRLHDVADIGGVPTVLYGVVSVSPESPPLGDATQDFTEVVHALAMAPGGWTTTEVVGMNTWESGFSRLSLGGDGLVVGETYELVTKSFFTVTVPGTPAAAAGGLSAEQLGVETSYSECEECPGGFAVAADGGTVAWIDRTDVVVFDVPTGTTRRWTVPEVGGVINRSLDVRRGNDGAVELIVDGRDASDGQPIEAVLVTLRPDGSATVWEGGSEAMSFGP